MLAQLASTLGVFLKEAPAEAAEQAGPAGFEPCVTCVDGIGFWRDVHSEFAQEGFKCHS